MKVSIIIINYNTKQITQNCIDSIRLFVPENSNEIILVDNASTDGSKEIFSKDSHLRYIYNSQNLGFGKANNIGSAVAQGEYLFFLNSDTLLREDTVSILAEYLDKNPNAGAVGPLLIGPDNQDNGSYYSFRRCRILERLKGRFVKESLLEKGGYICGAALMMRKSLFDDIGGFDESFFMYYEEQDLQKRVYDNGFSCDIIRNTSIRHLRGASTRQSFSEYSMRQKSLNIYGKKHFSGMDYFQFRLSNILGTIIYVFSSKARGFSLKEKLTAIKMEIIRYDIA